MDLINSQNLAKKVKWLGFRKDVFSIMQSADLMIIPSWYEGTPNALLEALEIGLPCIVSDIPAHRDILIDSSCSLTFRPDSPKHLASMINYFLENPEKISDMMKKGQKIASHYTLVKMVSKHQVVYQEVMKKYGN